MLRYVSQEKSGILTEETLRTDVDGKLVVNKEKGKPDVVEVKAVMKHADGGVFCCAMGSVPLYLAKKYELASLGDVRDAFIAARKPSGMLEKEAGEEFDKLHPMPVKGSKSEKPVAPASVVVK